MLNHPRACNLALPDTAVAPPAVQTLRLRILATTDLHMQLRSYDYSAGARHDSGALARLAVLIGRLRSEGVDCLLFDNGDLLQGNAMGDLAARQAHRGQIHPAIAAMNLLGYDAAAPGNHDFNYGVATLLKAARDAAFPFVCSNLRVPGAAGVLRSRALLRRRMRCEDGSTVALRIGVIGLLPPQTVQWDRAEFGRAARARDICEAATAAARSLRRDGADLIVALAHSGIGAPRPEPWMENAAAALAGVADVDVIVAGHDHMVFPSALMRGNGVIDPVAGTLWGKPAVQPGQRGSHLGVIDLRLTREGGGRWRLRAHQSRALPVPADARDARGVVAVTARAHRATLGQLRRRIGTTARPLTTYFALVAPSPALGLIAAAQGWHVRNRLRDTAAAALPVVSAVAPFKAGGFGGPRHYTRIEAGPLTLRSLADLYTFPNRIEALRLTGRELADWLERSAAAFHRIRPGQPDQMLIDPAFPAYDFDVIAGLSYAFDLSQPARYDANGRLVDPRAGRVRGLRLNGRDLGPDDEVILATNNFRTATRAFGDDRQVLQSGAGAHEVLRNYIEEVGELAPEAPDWRFHPLPGASALFDTAPEAADYLPADGNPCITPAGPGEGGFARYRITF